MTEEERNKRIFIVIEGPDGGGKTTQANLLMNYFKEKGEDAVYVREPGGTEVGEEIRSILLKSRGGNCLMLPATQLLLFYASRNEFIYHVVTPQLREGKIVVTDRFEGSSFVYQVYAQGAPGGLMNTLHNFVVAGDLGEPNLCVVLDVPVEVTLARKENPDRVKQKTIYEEQNHDLLEKIRQGYIQYCEGYITGGVMWHIEETEPNAILIDGTRDKIVIHREIVDLAEYVIEEERKGRRHVPVRELTNYYHNKYL